MGIKNFNVKNIITLTGRKSQTPVAREISLPFVLAVSALLFGILSGIRLPNLWSVTHLLFDYSSGFTKRGLSGEFLSLVFGHAISYATLATVSFVIFSIWVFLLFLRLRALAKIDERIWLASAVVLISPGFAFLVHEIGYLDHVGLIVVFLCLLLPANLVGLLGRILFCGVMVLVHEPIFLTFFPVVALEFWLKGTLAGNRFAAVATFVLIAVTATNTYVMGQMSLPAERETAYIEHIEERASDFSIRQSAVKVLFRDGRDNLEIAVDLWQKKTRWVWAATGILFLLPLPIGLVFVTMYVVRRTPLSDRTKLALYLGILSSAFSPLLLNVIAWDIWRFFALTQISAFLVFITVITQLRTDKISRHGNLPAGYILAIFAVLGASTSIPLLDFYEVAKPPYLPHIFQLIDAWQGDVRWMQIPSRY